MRRAHDRQSNTAAWANQAYRPVDDGLEWCLIEAVGDLPTDEALDLTPASEDAHREARILGEYNLHNG